MNRFVLAFFCCIALFAEDNRAHFIGLTNFNSFSRQETNGAVELLSPVLDPHVQWEELIVSWNYPVRHSGLKAEVKVICPERETPWYCLGQWSWDGTEFPRQSVPGQKDSDATVDTDTLRMHTKAGPVRLRITLLGEKADSSKLAFLGLCFSKGAVSARDNLSSHDAHSLSVPEHSQADYIEGINAWCSPSCAGMLLEYWARELNRTELKHEIPEVARLVDDPNWPGTGNWPFNTAFAGAHHGMRGYVTRFTELSELAEWIRAGVPVACSVSYGFLKGNPEKGNGHLVVCIGFTEDGKVIVNDPGRKAVHQVYERENFIRAWAQSRNTVYLIYPEGMKVPSNRLQHWFER